jgi:hypothetical protein
MKHTVLLAGLALVLAMPAPAVASHDPSGTRFDRDFVSGRGSEAALYGYSFDARSGPSGEDPAGEVQFSSRGGFLIAGQVTCVTVRDNRATIGFDNPPFYPFQGPRFGFYFVEDSRGDPVPPPFPGFPAGPADRFSSTTTAEAPRACPAPTDANFESVSPIGYRPINEIVVHDATPLPTTKSQCKRGGWRQFGSAFKNQGACVKFVA